MTDSLTTVINNTMRINALKRIGIETVYDLVHHFPRRIIPAPLFCKNVTEIKGLECNEIAEGRVMIYAKLSKLKTYPPTGRMRVGRLVLTLHDDHNRRFEAIYFAKSPRYLKWLESKYKTGSQMLVIGKPGRSYNEYSALSFSHPEIIHQNGTNKSEFIEMYSKPRTVYGASARLNSQRIHDMIMDILPRIIDDLPNLLTTAEIEELYKNFKHSELSSNPLFLAQNARRMAFYQIHNPQSMQEYQQAREYLCFEEAYLLQTMLQMRLTANKHNTAIPRPLIADNDSLINRFTMNLPWELTDAQKSVYETISKELNSTTPMQRLVQGDVGSGKTVVAMLSIIQTVDNGGQTALLAPTEVLANQHFETITNLLGSLCNIGAPNRDSMQIRIELLTSKTKISTKRRILSELEHGEIDIIVGTHSLLHSAEQFHDLGLVVVDEQHRFGALQRNILKENRKNTPHLLCMSATPIPRSVAMTYFADLNISTIDELPRGRGKIETYIIRNDDERYLLRMWQRIREEIDKGHNAFIVVPRIDDDDISDSMNASVTSVNPSGIPVLEGNEILEISALLFEKMIAGGLEEVLNKESRSITSMKADIEENPYFKDISIGIMHGRLSHTEKQKVMSDFIESRVQILLSTTVIEVGIDIPNASVMLICDADKFGLATLHQLRGRIGRGKTDGICFLLESKGGATETGEKRLNAISKTTDGFKIASADLKIRGIGDIISSRQSGRKNSLRLVDVLGDIEIISIAASLSKAVITDDPTLDDHISLKQALTNAYTELEGEFIMRA